MLPSNKPPWGLSRGGLICKNDILGGGLIRRWGLSGGFTVDLLIPHSFPAFLVVRGVLFPNEGETFTCFQGKARKLGS